MEIKCVFYNPNKPSRFGSKMGEIDEKNCSIEEFKELSKTISELDLPLLA